MVSITEHYNAYPYPERDPKDEKTRLITGSPSHPLEIDHVCFGGQRDWSTPLRALVAGGGTGDGLIQLATVLAQANRPAEITYLDLSTSARATAEARAKVRGLTNIRFETASLLHASDYGAFDYIDCCGVLHHLPDPDAGFRALRAALAPGGALGLMVYAPYGRSGVYPLQEAFGTLFAGLPPEGRLAQAKALFKTLPEGHPFKTNPHLNDHRASDAGFYDLLLHGQDRAYGVSDLLQALDAADLTLTRFATPALYDLAQITQVPDGLSPEAQMAVAEKLRGTIRVHVAYARPKGQEAPRAKPSNRALVPHLKGVAPQALARAVAQGKPVPVTSDGVTAQVTLPKSSAVVLAGIDGRRSLAEIAQGARLDPLAFGAAWSPVHQALEPWGLILYSNLLRG